MMKLKVNDTIVDLKELDCLITEIPVGEYDIVNVTDDTIRIYSPQLDVPYNNIDKTLIDLKVIEYI